MAERPQQLPSHFDVQIAPEIEPGIHADFASIWHTPDTFVLDFAALRQPPLLGEDEDSGKKVVVFPTRIVTRVKIAPGQIFELMRALNTELANWESETGRKASDEPGVT